MTTPGDELIAFNRARLDEDERELKADPPRGLGYANLTARVAAGITAKRGIVDVCEEAIEAQGDYAEDGQEWLALNVLRMLAFEWNSSPDYQAHWTGPARPGRGLGAP